MASFLWTLVLLFVWLMLCRYCRGLLLLIPFTMPKKRTSAKSKNDEQTNEGSESLSKKEYHAKRAELDLLSDMTLQDLPIELLEYIIVQAVVMEVMGLKLAKSVWKEKADLVIRRLSQVCSQWSSLLATNSFRTKHNRILEGSAQTIRLEVLHETPIQSGFIEAMTTLNGDIFILYRNSPKDEDYSINVYTRNDLEKVTNVIPLPTTNPGRMTGCSVSNCVYLIINSSSIFRILKDADHQFKKAPFLIHDQSIIMMHVSRNGNLLIYSSKSGSHSKVVSTYDTNGCLQSEIEVSLDHLDKYDNLIQKSNGNVVFAYINDKKFQITLVEFDTSGNVVRTYESPYNYDSSVIFADIYGRIMITETFDGMELLDSEFNLLGKYSLKQDKGKHLFLFDMQYDTERNEIWRLHGDKIAQTNVLTTFRFIEE